MVRKAVVQVCCAMWTRPVAQCPPNSWTHLHCLHKRPTPPLLPHRLQRYPISTRPSPNSKPNERPTTHPKRHQLISTNPHPKTKWTTVMYCHGWRRLLRNDNERKRNTAKPHHHNRNPNHNYNPSNHPAYYPTRPEQHPRHPRWKTSPRPCNRFRQTLLH